MTKRVCLYGVVGAIVAVGACGASRTLRFVGSHRCIADDGLCELPDPPLAPKKKDEALEAAQVVIDAFLQGSASLCGRSFAVLEKSHEVVIPEELSRNQHRKSYGKVKTVPRTISRASMWAARVARISLMGKPFSVIGGFGIRLRCEIIANEEARSLPEWMADVSTRHRNVVTIEEVHDYRVVWSDHRVVLVVRPPAGVDGGCF